MNHSAGRVAGGLVLLVAVWIGVYWWWPSEPSISFAQPDDTIRGVKPREGEKVAPPVLPPEVVRPKVEAQREAPALPRVEVPEPPKQVVVPPEFTKHTVVKGETFESIAKKYFGSTARVGLIANANPFVDPARLAAGRVLNIPRDPGNIQGVPVGPVVEGAGGQPRSERGGTQPAEEYVVQEGDSLSQIAAEVYGDSKLARLIYEANKDQLSSENAIRVGQRLRIPAKPRG